MIGDFPACLAIIRKEEGGNDDDPHDHGGRTSRGITQREWDAYRATRPNLPADVWQAPNADIDAIYHDQYWAPYCDALPAGIDLVFFNTAVNSGRQQAVKELQRALGVEADGMLGMVTRQAVASYADIPGLIRKACALRRAYYRALAQFPRYGRGWLARTDRVEQSALLLASAHPAVPAMHPEIDSTPEQPDVTVSAKAPPTAAAEPPVSQTTGAAVTTGSAGASAALEQVRSASDQLAPFSYTLKAVQYVLIGLAVIGLCLTAYAIWKNSKVKEAVG